MAIKKSQKENIEYISVTYPHIGNADYYMSQDYRNKLKEMKCTLSDSDVDEYLQEIRVNDKYRKKLETVSRLLMLSYAVLTWVLIISSGIMSPPIVNESEVLKGGDLTEYAYMAGIVLMSLIYLWIGHNLKKSVEKKKEKETALEKTGVMLDSEGNEVYLIWFLYHNLYFKSEEDRSLFLVEKYRKYNRPLSVALSECKENYKDIEQCLKEKLNVVKKELKAELNIK